MKTNIGLGIPGYDKETYNQMVNTSFTQLEKKQTPKQTIDEEPNTSEFFEMYSKLFYDIPQYGGTQSHEYLILQSSKYINYSQNLEEIQAMQEEISQLRTQLLEERQKNIENLTPSNINQSPNTNNSSNTNNSTSY